MASVWPGRLTLKRTLVPGSPRRNPTALSTLQPSVDVAFDLGDLVAAADAGAFGRGTVDGRHHGRKVVAERNQNAQAAELAVRADHQVFVFQSVEVLAVGIELVQHALDGFFDEQVGVDFVDVVLRDFLQDLGEDLEVMIDVGALGLRGGLTLSESTPRNPDRQDDEREDGDGDDELTCGETLHGSSLLRSTCWPAKRRFARYLQHVFQCPGAREPASISSLF